MKKLLKKLVVLAMAAVIGFGAVTAATQVEAKAASKAEVQLLLYKAQASYKAYEVKLQKINLALNYNKKEMADVQQKLVTAQKYKLTKLVKQYKARMKTLNKKQTLLWKEAGVCQGKMAELKKKIAVYQAWLKAH